MLLDVAVVCILAGADNVEAGTVLATQFEVRSVALVRTRYATVVALLFRGITQGWGQARGDRGPIKKTWRAPLQFGKVVWIASIGTRRGATRRRALRIPVGRIIGVGVQRCLAQLGARAAVYLIPRLVAVANLKTCGVALVFARNTGAATSDTRVAKVGVLTVRYIPACLICLTLVQSRAAAKSLSCKAWEAAVGVGIAVGHRIAGGGRGPTVTGRCAGLKIPRRAAIRTRYTGHAASASGVTQITRAGGQWLPLVVLADLQCGRCALIDAIRIATGNGRTTRGAAAARFARVAANAAAAISPFAGTPLSANAARCATSTGARVLLSHRVVAES